MISISDNLKQKLYTGAPKTLTLTFSDGTVITNDSIKQGSLSLEQMLCDQEQFAFGLCNAACFKIQVLYEAASQVTYTSNMLTQSGENLATESGDEIAIEKSTVSNLRQGGYKGLWVDVDFGVDGENETIRLGRFRVEEDELTDDRLYRDLVCYDALFGVLDKDVTPWYTDLMLRMPMTVRDFRNSFFSYVGVEQNSIVLPNDNVNIEQTVIASGENAISGRTVLNVICEMNGCSGVIDNQGRFKYVFFNLNPLVQVVDNGAYITGSTLTPEGFHQGSFKFKDYEMLPMSGIQLRESDTDSGAITGNASNAYAITGNFLTYGKGSAEKQAIVDTIYNQVREFHYRPAQVEVRAMPWLEVGDCVEIVGDKVTSVVPILHRSMNGITAAYDVYTAKGTETFSYNINSLTNRFEQVRQKTLEIKQSVDEVSTRMTEKFLDIDGDLIEYESLIRQTQRDILHEVSERENGETILRSEISQTSSSFTALVESRTSLAYIIGKINDNGDSSLKIHGDQVDIEGNTTFTSMIDNSITQILGGNIITNIIYADAGMYGDLAVDELITTRRIQLYLNDDHSRDDYIHIKDSRINFVSGDIVGPESISQPFPTVPARNNKGDLLYWQEDITTAQVVNGWYEIGGKRVALTPNSTEWPAVHFKYNDSHAGRVLIDDATGILKLFFAKEFSSGVNGDPAYIEGNTTWLKFGSNDHEIGLDQTHDANISNMYLSSPHLRLEMAHNAPYGDRYYGLFLKEPATGGWGDPYPVTPTIYINESDFNSLATFDPNGYFSNAPVGTIIAVLEDTP